MQMVIYTGAVYVRAVTKHTEIVHETRSGKPISAGKKALKVQCVKIRGIVQISAELSNSFGFFRWFSSSNNYPEPRVTHRV